METLFDVNDIEKHPVKKGKIIFLDFDQNHNHKLLSDYFTNIFPKKNKFKIGQKTCIRIRGMIKCHAIVERRRIMTLSEMMVCGYNMTDMGMNERDFMSFMKQIYSTKKWWYDSETEMCIVFFKKIAQLSLF